MVYSKQIYTGNHSVNGMLLHARTRTINVWTCVSPVPTAFSDLRSMTLILDPRLASDRPPSTHPSIRTYVWPASLSFIMGTGDLQDDLPLHTYVELANHWSLVVKRIETLTTTITGHVTAYVVIRLVTLSIQPSCLSESGHRPIGGGAVHFSLFSCMPNINEVTIKIRFHNIDEEQQLILWVIFMTNVANCLYFAWKQRVFSSAITKLLERPLG